MTKKYSKVTAIILSLLIFAYCIPFSVFAVGTDSVFTSETESADSMVEDSLEFVEDEVIGEVAEIIEMRQENVKHFRLANGTYEAVIYPQAVHRKDENGLWQDIDNDLELKNVEGNQKYTTKDHRVRFSKKFEFNNQLFSLNENGYSVSMTLLNTDNYSPSSSPSLNLGEISTSSTSVVNPERDRSENNSYGSLEEAALVDNRSSILYSGIKANTDIEYVLQGNNIKENIIINAVSDSYEYLFQIGLVGLTAQLDSLGNIKLTDSETGQSKYIIPAPYMYDANGVYSYDVHYELALISNGRYALNIVADEDWINADGRAFPVTIDPTLILDILPSDAYTNAASPDSWYGFSEELWISNYRTTYIQIDIPELPAEATINSAELHISYYYNVSTGTLVAGAYQILEDWDELSIKYNNAPSVSTTLLSTANLFASSLITASSPGPATFDITDAAVAWHSGTAGNYGIALKRQSGSNASVILKSYEAEEDYAYISVNYTYYLPDGVYAITSEVTRHWITVEGDSKYAGSNLQHEYAADSPADADVFDRASLFKISRKSGTYYVIRSMLNNNLSFGISGTEIITKEIPSDDADVLFADTFSIESDGKQGLVIRPYGTSYYIHMPSSSADLTTIYKTDATNRSRWSFEQYTGDHRTGMSVTRPGSWSDIGIVVGNSGNIAAFGWSTRINANTVTLGIKSGYEAMGTLATQTDSYEKTFTAKNPGVVSFSTIVKYATGTIAGSGTFSYNIVPQQGTYFIQNAGTEKYIDIEGPSTAEGAIIQQWDFSTANQKKWIIEHVSGSGGYVRIKSVYSDLYVGVDSSSTTTVRQYSTKNNYTLWKIQRSTKGNIILICKATEQTGYSLSIPVTSNFNGTNLIQTTYTNDPNTNDEWYLVNKVISYVNYYDSTFANNTQLKQYIALANSFSNLVYARYYNVGLYRDGEAIQYAPLINSCPTGENMPCTDISCGADCSSKHHKNRISISDYLYNNPREHNHIYTLWTNHASGTYCKEISNVHTTSTALACVINHRPVIHFLRISGTSAEDQLACMTISLVHETAHTFGMGEVYDNAGHDDPLGTICVMERLDVQDAYTFYENVINGSVLPFCNSCDTAMMEYTSNISISGN